MSSIVLLIWKMRVGLTRHFIKQMLIHVPLPSIDMNEREAAASF